MPGFHQVKAWPPSLLEHTACPACGRNGNGFRYAFEPFRVVECEGCKSAYLSPRLVEREIVRLYQSGYFSSGESSELGYSNYSSLEVGLRRTFERRYRFLKPLVRGGRAVDVGCAMGYALDCLRADFEDRIGIDLAPEAIDEVNRRGHRGICGMLGDAKLEPGTVSLLLSMDTVEHLYDPGGVIREMAAALRPGGVVALVTPDYGSLLRRASGRNWVSFKIPEHVTYFSRAGMSQLLRESGLEVVKYATDIQYSPIGLILDRASKVLPRTGQLLGKVMGPLAGSFVPVYNGMFLVIARKPIP